MAKPKSKITPEVQSRAILTAFKRSDNVAFKGKMVAEMLKLHRTFIYSVFNRTVGRCNPNVSFPSDIETVVFSCYMYDATFKAMTDFTMETTGKFLTFYVWRIRWGCNRLLSENHTKSLVHKPHQVLNRTSKKTTIANEESLVEELSHKLKDSDADSSVALDLLISA
jgi:hypothetical protein